MSAHSERSPSPPWSSRGALALAWLALVLPAVPVTHRFFGWVGVVSYGLFLAGAVPWLTNRLLGKAHEDRTVNAATKGGLLVLAIGFVTLYPLLDQGLAGGSDNDDAIDVGVWELLAGHYPYYARTYLGNSLAPLPGALVLATPFVLLFGYAAIQNIFLLAVLLFLVGRLRASHSRAPALLVAMMFMGVSFGSELFTGSDRYANSISVCIGVLLVMKTASVSGYRWFFSSVYLGLTLSWRIPFALIVPVLLAGLHYRVGGKRTCMTALLIGTSFSAVTLPFFLYDPGGFTPLQVQNRLAHFDGVLSSGGLAVYGFAAAVSVGLSLHRSNQHDLGMLLNLAIGQFVVVIGATGLQLFVTDGRAFGFLAYGSFFSIFAVVAAVIALDRRMMHGPYSPSLVKGEAVG